MPHRYTGQIAGVLSVVVEDHKGTAGSREYISANDGGCIAPIRLTYKEG